MSVGRFQRTRVDSLCERRIKALGVSPPLRSGPWQGDTPLAPAQAGYGRPYPPGFRSSFRDRAAEETDHPREVIEAALAHVVPN